MHICKITHKVSNFAIGREIDAFSHKILGLTCLESPSKAQNWHTYPSTCDKEPGDFRVYHYVSNKRSRSLAGQHTAILWSCPAVNLDLRGIHTKKKHQKPKGRPDFTRKEGKNRWIGHYFAIFGVNKTFFVYNTYTLWLLHHREQPYGVIIIVCKYYIHKMFLLTQKLQKSVKIRGYFALFFLWNQRFAFYGHNESFMVSTLFRVMPFDLLSLLLMQKMKA